MSISFFRLFRVARLVKLLNKNENIRTLLWTFMKSFQVDRIEKTKRCSCFVIGFALGHAVDRPHLLHLRHGGDADDGQDCHPGHGGLQRAQVGNRKSRSRTDPIHFHRNNNFQSFTMAFLVLFRSATGEAWQEIMLDCVPG